MTRSRRLHHLTHFHHTVHASRRQFSQEPLLHSAHATAHRPDVSQYGSGPIAHKHEYMNKSLVPTSGTYNANQPPSCGARRAPHNRPTCARSHARDRLRHITKYINAPSLRRTSSLGLTMPSAEASRCALRSSPPHEQDLMFMQSRTNLAGTRSSVESQTRDGQHELELGPFCPQPQCGSLINLTARRNKTPRSKNPDRSHHIIQDRKNGNETNK